MSVRSECQILNDDDVESGQCSDDEVLIVKKEKIIKKRKKSHKNRKRKYSSSSCSFEPLIEFFNPYFVNRERFIFKAEQIDEAEVNNNVEIANSTNINKDESNFIHQHLPNNYNESVASEYNSKNSEINGTIENIQLQQTIERRELAYCIDLSGIDTITSDLNHYLLDLGLSASLIEDILKVYSMEEGHEEAPLSENDDDERYEQEMINDIPIIDHNIYSDQSLSGGYSPEHIIDSQPAIHHLHVTYAPINRKTNDIRPLNNHIIDPMSIPAVGPRDPRLTNTTKLLLQVKHPEAAKPTTEDVALEVCHSVMTAEWETTVINVVKTHLKLYLTHNDINREEYKSIMKRAVNKILTSGEKKLETDKISKFLHSYVLMTQKSRLLNNNS